VVDDWRLTLLLTFRLSVSAVCCLVMSFQWLAYILVVSLCNLVVVSKLQGDSRRLAYGKRSPERFNRRAIGIYMDNNQGKLLG